MLTAPLLSGIVLLLGVIWSAGFAAITIGSLNMMTSMFAVVLMGLGIDFSIHIISAYTENRASGRSISAALTETFSKSGNGIVVGALTTALAFFTMLISSNAGMKEFGFIAGSGVIFCMLAAILVLPSLLVLQEKWSRKRPSTNVRPFIFMGSCAEKISRSPQKFLLLSLLITTLLGYSASQIKFDYNYLNLEPKGLETIYFQDAMIDEFDATPDMVMAAANSIEEARRIAEAAKDLASVGLVNSISEYLPTEQSQLERRPYLKQIRQYLEQPATEFSQKQLDLLIDELYRLEDNIIELAQLAFMGGQDKVDQKARSITGNLELPIEQRNSLVSTLVETIEQNPKSAIAQLQAFQKAYEPDLRAKAQQMAANDKVEFSDLPPNIVNQFTNSARDQFLVSIYPKQQAWNFQFLSRFTAQIHQISPRITGMPPIFYILIKLIGRDGTIAATLTLLVVFLLLWFDFRSVKLALLGMVPLLFGVAWMLGIMQLLGMKLNIVNTIGVPLILGMGIDDGVHVLHRFKAEGKRNLRLVFASTGKAIFLTSATTMLAFGSLGFAIYRGLASLGITLFIGIFACFFTTVLILPALLGSLFKIQD